MRQSLATMVVLLCSAGAWNHVRADSALPVLAITHVTVIDATGAPAQADQTIVIKDGRIVALSKSADKPAPAGAEVRANPFSHGKWRQTERAIDLARSPFAR